VGEVRHRGRTPTALQAFLDRTPFFAKGRPRRFCDDVIATPRNRAFATDREISTQMAFGKILDELSKTDSDLAARIVTTSPDVTGTTNLGPWVNQAQAVRAGRAGRYLQGRRTFPRPPNGSSRPRASISSSALPR
jgi:pyruvate dehydrogenase complex dehydrogenase (E1) component